MRHQESSNLVLSIFIAMVALALVASGCGEETDDGGGFVAPTGGEGGASSGDEEGDEGGLASFIVTDKITELIGLSCGCIDLFVENGSMPAGAQVSNAEECEALLVPSLLAAFHIEDPDCVNALMLTNTKVNDAMTCAASILDELVDCQNDVACADPFSVQACNAIDQEASVVTCKFDDQELKDVLADECGLAGGNTLTEIFDCGNGEEVKAFKVCDGDSNCTNGADETDCVASGFECADGSVIDDGALCDGVDDCPDGDDESGDLCG
jgi:hypothetical protein